MVIFPEEFDPSTYLILNPDVLAAGVDPKEHWALFGRFENRKYKHGRIDTSKKIEPKKIALLLMCKDEGHMLEAWIKYHKNIVHPSHIFIFDNGSTDPLTIQNLDYAQSLGCNVEKRFDQKKHFNNKGTVMVLKMWELDAFDDFDYYIPLDCDELMGVQVDNQFHVSSEKISNSLNLLPSSKLPLKILNGLIANPLYKGYFKKSGGHIKTFFCRETAKSLDVGFHDGKSVEDGDPIISPLVLINFHFMAFSETRKRAHQKLSGRVDTEDVKALLKYEADKKAGFHLASELLTTIEDYESKFSLEDYSYMPEILSILMATGCYEALSKIMDYRSE